MPEINHKTPEVKPPSPAEPVKEDATAKLAKELEAAGVTTNDLEKQVELILRRRAKEKAEAMRPKEPNWATLSEQDAYNPAVYIPTIEHDIPDYMNMRLKDPEYEVVWASKDQRRIGQLMAEGYEYLKAEHVHPSFTLPLKFSSDGLYIYQDVVCLRVHKRIIYSKRRHALEISKNQLKRKGADATVKGKLNSIIEADPFLENAMQSGGMGFYDTDPNAS